MSFYPPETASAKSDLTAKNRVWGFIAESVSENLETRRAALETHQENYDGSRRTASGIPLWPSRDPIEEQGGLNLYGFVGNDGANQFDVDGRWFQKFLQELLKRKAKGTANEPSDVGGGWISSHERLISEKEVGRCCICGSADGRSALAVVVGMDESCPNRFKFLSIVKERKYGTTVGGNADEEDATNVIPGTERTERDKCPS